MIIRMTTSLLILVYSEGGRPSMIDFMGMVINGRDFLELLNYPEQGHALRRGTNSCHVPLKHFLDFLYVH